MRKITRRTLVTIFALALLVMSPLALAYYNCSVTITVSSSGGQSCSRTCSFYDDATGEFQGTISMDYQC